MPISSKKLKDLSKKVDIKKLAAPAANEQDLIGKFKTAWPIAKGVLSTIKNISGEKVDKIIEDLIVGGDAIAGNPTGNIQVGLKKFCDSWQLVRLVVIPVVQIIPGKVGKIIREFIRTVDQISEQYS